MFTPTPARRAGFGKSLMEALSQYGDDLERETAAAGWLDAQNGHPSAEADYVDIDGRDLSGVYRSVFLLRCALAFAPEPAADLPEFLPACERELVEA